MSAHAASALPQVVFVCGRNSIRSPMAEALWRRRFGPGAQAVSCGVDPAAFPDGFMIAVMAEIGADLSRFECRGLGDVAPGPDTAVIALAAEAAAPARALAESAGSRFLDWAQPDPAAVEGKREQRLDAYRGVRDALIAKIEGFAKS